MPHSIKITGIAPPDLPGQPEPLRRQFWSIVAPIALKVKDAELAAGLDAQGEPLTASRRLRPKTIKYRRSAMTPSGKGDPSAPPLMPAYQKSRVRSLLAARAFATHAELYWRYDPFTGASFDVILNYMKALGWDVFGISKEGLATVKRQSWAAWTKWKKAGLAPTEKRSAFPAAALTAGPQSRIAGIIARSAEPNAGATAPVGVGKLGTRWITRGIEAPKVKDLKASKTRSGAMTGADWRRFFTAEEGPGPKPPKPKAAQPKPPKPKPPAYTSPGAFDLPVRGIKIGTPPEPIGRHLPTDEEIAKTKTKPKPVKAKTPPKPKLAPLPASPADVTEVKALGGSTGAKLVQDKSGKLWVMKKGANAGHLKEEGYADDLYRAMGADVPRSIIRDTPSGPVKFSEFLEGKTLGELKNTDPAAYAAAAAKLRERFVADALLGNWDVIGAGADNILVTPDGRVLRIDNGGSLRYRAQGALKSGSQFGPAVSELGTMRDTGVNAAAARIFGGVTDDEIKAQIKALLKHRATILKAAPDELKATLEARLDNLKEFTQPAKTFKGVKGWKATPADQFKTWPSTREADQYARDKWRDWDKSLSKEERDAIQQYKSSSSQLNAHHRSSSPGSTPGYLLSSVQQQTAALDAALERGKTTEPITVIRYFSLSDVGLTRGQLKLGMDIHDSGYLSTSINPNHSWTGERFEIRVPAGVPAGYAQMATPTHQGEYEVILGREPNVFRVVEIKNDAANTIVIEPVMTKTKPKAKKKGP